MSKKKESENTPEDPGVRIAQLLIFILAGTQILRHDVLDAIDVDRNEIVEIADNIEKYVNEIAHLALGADVDEWQAELERKRNRRQGKYE